MKATKATYVALVMYRTLIVREGWGGEWKEGAGRVSAVQKKRKKLKRRTKFRQHCGRMGLT